MKDTKIIILAAGKGTRMGGDLPKVLCPLNQTTMIEHLIKQLEPLNTKPVVVVGYRADLVKEKLGDKVTYALQEQQLGTGHAVLAAKEAVGDAKRVVILYGDMPLVSATTINTLLAAHDTHEGPLTMATVIAENFEGWRDAFLKYGHIVRDSEGRVTRIVESKDATPAELAIPEVSPGIFVIDTDWMWQNLANIKANNSQKEYYLVDLVGAAFDQKHSIVAVPVSEHEGLGANTPEQLKELERFA